MNIHWDQFKDEIVMILQNLIRINTSNPPGRELEAAKYLSGIANENGLKARVIETSPGRGNIMVYFDDYVDDKNADLILLSHLDVVPANSDGWEVPPFDAKIKDGWIWGRGAVDTKHLTVMELYSLILMKRIGIKTNKKIILMATADEESGSTFGIVKMIEMFPEIFKNSDVISEGGGFPVPIKDKTLYLCEIGQKGHCGIRFYFEKSKGNPFYVDNSNIAYSSELIQRIVNFQWEFKIPSATQSFIDAMLECYEKDNYSRLTLTEKLQLLKESVSPFMYKLIKAMTQNTLSPTIWKGGRKRRGGVFDSLIEVDCRILPGVTKDMLEDKIKILCSGLPVGWEINKFSEGYESKYSGRLFDILNTKIEERISNGTIVPFIATGGSDGRFLRDFNCRVYGFSPVLNDMKFETVVPMVHGINERISIDSLIFGTKILFESINEYCREGE